MMKMTKMTKMLKLFSLSLTLILFLLIAVINQPVFASGCASCGGGVSTSSNLSVDVSSSMTTRSNCGSCGKCEPNLNSFSYSLNNGNMNLDCNPACSTRACCPKCPPLCKTKCRVKRKKRHRPIKKQIVKQVTVVEEEPIVEEGLLISGRKIICPPYSPAKTYDCVVMFPGDIVDLTCKEFTQKVSDCVPYTCQAPNAQDPSIKTVWNIEEKIGDERCKISNTTDFVGLKDNNGKPVPVTQTCEYDLVGIVGLAQRLLDMRSRFYHFTTDQNFEGIHNCAFTVSGVPIKEAMKTIRLGDR